LPAVQSQLHASTSASSSTSSAAPTDDDFASMQKRIDKLTRELSSERQRCEAAMSSSAQLQQRLDAALNMASGNTALSFGFEALLPPSPPRLNTQVVVADSPAPSLHAQLSKVSISASEARAMAVAVASTAAAARFTETATLERVNARVGAAAASCAKMVGDVSCVLRQLQLSKGQVRDGQLRLRAAQVTSCPLLLALFLDLSLIFQLRQFHSLVSSISHLHQRTIMHFKTAAAASSFLFLLLFAFILAVVLLDYDELAQIIGLNLPQ
jgi:hypothetical protein